MIHETLPPPHPLPWLGHQLWQGQNCKPESHVSPPNSTCRHLKSNVSSSGSDTQFTTFVCLFIWMLYRLLLPQLESISCQLHLRKLHPSPPPLLRPKSTRIIVSLLTSFCAAVVQGNWLSSRLCNLSTRLPREFCSHIAVTSKQPWELESDLFFSNKSKH